MRQSTSTEDGKKTVSGHYTAYGYLATDSASSQSMTGGSTFANRWWMHVDAENRVDYAAHRQRGKMWKQKVIDRDIIPLAVCSVASASVI